MGEVTIKLHDVLHEPTDFSASDVADYIERYIRTYPVKEVRVSKGYANSPVFITLEHSGFTMEEIRRICRDAANGFQTKVRSVDVDQVVKDRNIKILT